MARTMETASSGDAVPAEKSSAPIPAANPRTFARLYEGVVVELIREYSKIEDEWHPDFLRECVDVTGLSPAPALGWVRDAGGKLAPKA